MRLGYIVSAFIIILLFVLRRDLALLFTDKEEIVRGASLAFLVVLAGIVAQNARVIYSGCLRGAGDVKYVALISLLSVSIVRPLMTWALCHPLNRMYPELYLAYTGPWIAYVIDAWIRTVLLWRRVKSGRYLDTRL